MQGYDDAEYARTRLIETIVMYNGKPVTILLINGNRCVASYLHNGEHIECNINDLDINPVPLGYLNNGREALYVARTPMRRDWRQGLRKVNMRVLSNDGDDMAARLRWDWQQVANTITGIYPTFAACFDAITNNRKSIAFSRNFAVKQNKSLEYKGRFIVGTIERDYSYNLLPRFMWVREALEEEFA